MKLIFKYDNKDYTLDIQKGEDLFGAIDFFLKDNRISLNALKGLKIKESKDDGLISTYIAETIIKIFQLALS